MRDHRWCNVYRMDDRVSRWLRDNWYDEQERSPSLALAKAGLARLINWPDTLQELRPFTKWQEGAVGYRLSVRKARGDKIFTGAYIINGVKGQDKVRTVCEQVSQMHEDAKRILHPDSMRDTWEWLMQVRGIGSFMAGQIVADLRQVVPGTWKDRFEWAPVGPGSARGMRRLLGLPHTGAMAQKQFDALLPVLLLRVMNDKQVHDIFKDRRCEAMDLQNCLCEFDKYERLRLGQGEVRSGYAGMPTAADLFKQ